MIYLGSDHGGFELKKAIKKFLQEQEYEYDDLGNIEFNPKDDYTDYAFKVAEKVAENYDDEEKWEDTAKGILLCRSAAGMVIAANKVNGVRAVAAFDADSAKHSREHNDANVLAVSGDWISEEQAKKIVKVWLDANFSNEKRHKRRIKKIRDYENK